jgi:transcriptional regulator NrdR family protein
MYDFFDEEDDDDFDEENFDDEAYLNNIVNYVKKSIRKDPENAIEMDDVKHLVMGELEYEATLDDIF